MSITMGKTIHRKPKLCKNGYTYVIEKKRPDRIFWMCENSEYSCASRLTTNLNTLQPTLIIPPSEHNHFPEATRTHVARLTNYERFYCAELPPTIVYSKELPEEPETLDQLKWDAVEPFTETLSKKQFLYASMSTTCGSKMLLFTTEENLHYLSRSQSVLTNVINWSAPNLFTRLYTLHCHVGYSERTQRILPVVYCLMEHKIKAAYVMIFEKIRSLIQDLIGDDFDPIFFITDFEIAALDAAKKVFPSAIIHGCYFHLAESVYRRVLHEHLKSKYINDPEFNLLVRQLYALSLLPANKIEKAYLLLKPLFGPEACGLLEWWESNYVLGELQCSGLRSVPLFPLEVWSCYEVYKANQPRTINAAKSWCYRFNNLVGTKHVGLFPTLEALRVEQRETEFTCSRFMRGYPNPKKTPKEIEREMRVQNLMKKRLDLPVLEFLRRMAQALSTK